MSAKTLRMALYGLVAVVVLYGATMLVGGGDGGSAAGDGALEDALAELATEPHTDFAISGPRDTLRLERGAAGWTVNGFEADSGAVSRFLRAVAEVEVGNVAAANPANHARLGIAADSAWTIAAEGRPAILLGKAGNRFRTAYARLPGADRVSHIEGDLRSAAARPLVDWRDKVIVETDTAMVAAIRVARDGRTVLYERQDSSWTTGGAEADATTVRNILQELASMRATGFAPEGFEMPAEPERAVVATDAEGNELAALTLAEGEGNYRVMAAGRSYIFEVASFRADRVAPGPDEG